MSLPRLSYMCLLLWLTTTAWTDVARADAPGTEAPAAEPGVSQPNLTFGSPRATLKHFLESFYQETGADLVRAANCLDLSALPAEVRRLKGPELAARLKDIIDRIQFIEFDQVPDHPQGPPWILLRGPDGEVAIDSGPDGRWLFTTATVSSIHGLERVLADRARVAETGPVPTPTSMAGFIRRHIPAGWREPVLMLEGWQWLGVLTVVFIGVVVDRIVVALVTGSILGFFSRRMVRLDQKLLSRVLRPLGLLLMTLFWGLGIVWLDLPLDILGIYLGAVRVVAIIVAVVTTYRLVDLIADLAMKRALQTESKVDDLLVPLMRKTLKVFVVAFGGVMVAQNLEINVTSLVAGLGLGGLAFALAAKDAVSNLFGSITVLIDRPFQVGDWVKIGDVEGTVEELGFRSTRIRTFYNSLITLPNANLISAAVDNLGARSFRRWSTRLGLAYHTPPERIDAFCEGIRELVRVHPYTRKDYYLIYFNEFGASSLEVLVYVFFATPDWATELQERHRLGVDIVRLAQELEIEFAFPTRTLYLRQEDWRTPAIAGTEYPDRSRELSAAAGRTARRLVQTALGGETPSVVRFAAPAPGDPPASDPT